MHENLLRQSDITNGLHIHYMLVAQDIYLVGIISVRSSCIRMPRKPFIICNESNL